MYGCPCPGISLAAADGINIVFEGQFYLGPPASGAPAHWHSGAINVMAFGRKRWALFPPYEGSFYSIKPSVDFFKWDLPEVEALSKVSVLAC